MPSRYLQSIYKQYTVFLKDQEAQKAAAAADMIDELEDGTMSGGVSHNNATHPSNNSNNKNIVSIRTEQLAKMKENLAKINAENEADYKPKNDPKTQEVRNAQLAKMQANVMAGRDDE